MWTVLLKRYTSVSRSNIMNLKKQLHDVKKNTDTIIQYLQRIKEAIDKLAAVGTLVDDEDLLHIVLKGLPSEYESFSSAMLTKNESVPFEELHVLMITQEELLKSSQANSKENSIMAMAANTPNTVNSTIQHLEVVFTIEAVVTSTIGAEAITGEAFSRGGYNQPNQDILLMEVTINPMEPFPNPNFPQSPPNFSPIQP
jgi:hypothetical protein